MADKKVTLEIKNVSKSFAKVENDEVTHALNKIDLSLELQWAFLIIHVF